jgi:hypothetical protein
MKKFIFLLMFLSCVAWVMAVDRELLLISNLIGMTFGFITASYLWIYGRQ